MADEEEHPLLEIIASRKRKEAREEAAKAEYDAAIDALRPNWHKALALLVEEIDIANKLFTQHGLPYEFLLSEKPRDSREGDGYFDACDIELLINEDGDSLLSADITALHNGIVSADWFPEGSSVPSIRDSFNIHEVTAADWRAHLARVAAEALK
jgi:hypothetical protein